MHFDIVLRELLTFHDQEVFENLWTEGRPDDLVCFQGSQSIRQRSRQVANLIAVNLLGAEMADVAIEWLRRQDPVLDAVQPGRQQSGQQQVRLRGVVRRSKLQVPPFANT